MDCRDWFDGVIANTDSAEDVPTAPFHPGHKLSGPFAVDGAKPGDLSHGFRPVLPGFHPGSL